MRSALLLLAALAPVAALAAKPPAYDPAWTVETPKDAPATLTYGQPATVGFACVKKSKEVSVRFLVPKTLADHKDGDTWVDAAGIKAPWPASVGLASGTETTTLRGQAEPNPDGPGSVLTTDVSTAAPVLAAFGKTGQITLTGFGEAHPQPPAKPGAVRKLLGFCD
jgi:hypothetical protein